MALGLGLFGKIFGSEKALESTIGAVSRGLDSLIYTEQEKEDDARKERAEARGMVVQWMETTKGQNLSRRFLALVIAGTWLLQYWFIMVVGVATVWTEDAVMVAKMEASIATISLSADGMTGAMMLILTFYFAAPHIGNVVGVAMERFGKNPTK